MFSYLADKLNIQKLGEVLAPTLTPEQELHSAIEGGLQDKVLRLLDEQQVSPYAENAGGSRPIHTAAYYGRVAILETLLSRGVEVDALGPRDNTPLHFAAAQGHMPAVKFLIDQGANPAARNRNRHTPYDVAKGDTIRQYLLPLQFQHEDPNEALAMLPPGITPTVDDNTPRPVYAPPPTDDMMMQQQQNGVGFGAPPQAPINPLFAPPTHSAIPRRPPGARVVTAGTYRPIQADGFGTSVGNEALTAKYGNVPEVRATAPPPPIMMAVPPQDPSATAPSPVPMPGNSNPFVGSGTRAVPSPPISGGGFQPPYGAPHSNGPRGALPPQFKIFNPKFAAGNTSSAAPFAAPPQDASAAFAQPPPFAAPPPVAAGGEAMPMPFPNDPAAEEVTLSANANVLQ